jgi:hypothetical protein
MLSAEVRDKLGPIGFLPVTGSREQLTAHIEAELALWSEIVSRGQHQDRLNGTRFTFRGSQDHEQRYDL